MGQEGVIVMTRRAMLLGTAGTLAMFSLFKWGSPGDAAPAETFEVEKSDAEWRRILTSAQYDVLRKHGTERAGTSPLNKEKRKGTFACAGCDLPLSRPGPKFKRGTAWPTFFRPPEKAAGPCRCSRRRQSWKAAPAGQASIARSRRRSARRSTRPFS